MLPEQQVFLIDIIFNFRTGFYVKMDDNQRGSDDTDLVMCSILY